jgi:catecholate siderophore receptor
MTADRRGGNTLLRKVLAAGTGLGVLQAVAVQAQDAASSPNQASEEVYIFGRRDAYKTATSSLGKLVAPLIDTPQSIDTISQQVMQDRGVTDFNQALKTAPGITLGAGEFKSLGNSPTIRGFVARDDMFLDGVRDYGDYYRDPFNLESIEVLQGPSGILFGRGSTGGVIEQASKLPRLDPFIAGTVMGGTDDTRRATIDVNEPLAALGEGAAFRINGMVHKAQVTDRDVITDSRWGIAPTLALGLGTPTRLIVSFYHQDNNDIPDYGLPYLGNLPAAVPRSNNYGFRNDYMRTRTDIGTIRLSHDFSDRFSLQNVVRYADYERQFRFSEPLTATTLPATTPVATVTVTRNDNTGASDDRMLWDQFFGTVRWDLGAVHNASVLGVEGGHEKAAPTFYNSAGVPGTNLLNPDENQYFSAARTYPRYKTHLIGSSAGPFAMDTATYGRWTAILGLRWDYFHVDYNDYDFSTTTSALLTKTDHILHTDEMTGYRGAIAYKIADNGDAYFSFGTSFNPSAEDLSLISSSRSFSLDNAQLDPEKNESYELGTKWALVHHRLDVSGALFRIEKDNARVPDPNNVALSILAGSQRVDGAEVRLEGRITQHWQITGGYIYLHSQQTGSIPGAAPVGSPLMNTPKHALTFWSVYQVMPRFQIGGGGRFVSSQYTQNVPPAKTVPGFWAFDAMARYAITTRVDAQLNLNNLANRYYYDQLHFFHVVPAEGRTAFLSLNVRF